MPEIACQTEDMEDVLSKLVNELSDQDDTILSLKKKLKNMTMRNIKSSGDLETIKDAIKKLCDNDIDFKYSLINWYFLYIYFLYYFILFYIFYEIL